MNKKNNFGYTDVELKELKEFADLQFIGEVGYEDSDGALVYVEEFNLDLNNPWYDSSGRFHLTDKGAVEEWGENIVKTWCEKAKTYMKEHPNWKAKLEEKIRKNENCL